MGVVIGSNYKLCNFYVTLKLHIFLKIEQTYTRIPLPLPSGKKNL